MGADRAARGEFGDAAGTPRLKMKDLERATGVGRETIRFYIRSGLLPQPQRLGRNVAYYDRSFVGRIRLIKELKERRFLPLRVIKAMVEGESDLAPAEVRTLLDLDRRLFRAAGIDLRRPPVGLGEVARRTGVSAAEIRKLAAIGAIEITRRKGAQWLDEGSARIVELLAELRRVGFTDELGFGPDSLGLYVETVRSLVREELRVFARGVTGRAASERVSAMAEAAIEILNQVIGVMRTILLLRAIKYGDIPPRPQRVGRISKVPRIPGRARRSSPQKAAEPK